MFNKNSIYNTNTRNTINYVTNGSVTNGLSNFRPKDDFIYLDKDDISLYESNNQTKKKVPITKTKYKNIYCVNCGEKGHVVKECEGPITSFGIIAFKVVKSQNEEQQDTNNCLKNIIKTSINKYKQKPEYINLYKNTNTYPKIKFLMIQRKDTMGFTDFVRGKYPDKEEDANKILPIFLNEMTYEEKSRLLNDSFDDIWFNLWVNHESKIFKSEYDSAHKKFQKHNIRKLVDNSKMSFDYTELGFPKGRRNMKESNIGCAEREFYEETGYNKTHYDFIKEYPTIVEEFVGTNGVTYKHIYYLVKMKDDIPPPRIDYKNKIQIGEVQNIGWVSFEECMSIIRPYDVAKKTVITNVYNDLVEMNNNFVCSNFYYTSKKQFRSSPRNINSQKQISNYHFKSI